MLLQRRTLALTGKSRKKGAVQSELACICNVPHKNFFIIVKASFKFESRDVSSLTNLKHPTHSLVTKFINFSKSQNKVL